MAHHYTTVVPGMTPSARLPLDPDFIMQDVDLLEKMWGTIAEWQQLYSGWKDGSFGDLKVEEMEEAAGRVAKSLQRLGREIKNWPAWAWIKVSILLTCLLA